MKRIQRILPAILAVSVAAPVYPAAAAVAPLPGLPTEGVVCWIEFRGSGKGIVDIIPIGDLYGVPIGMRCLWFGRELLPDEPPCNVCHAMLLDYGADVPVKGYVAVGFEWLDRAARAADPAEAERSRNTARDWFLAVARALPDRDPVIRDSGHIDLPKGEFVSSSPDWLASASGDIVAGLRMLADGEIGPGMHRLDRAYQGLRTHA